MIFTNTATIEAMLDPIMRGQCIVPQIQGHPFYDNRIEFLKANVIYGYTKEEVEEIQKCSSDFFYFIENYCKIFTEDGYRVIKLRDYQQQTLQNILENKFNHVQFDRQLGLTTIISLYTLWFATFNHGKYILNICESKNAYYQDLIVRLIEGLPYFLKPRFMRCNQDYISFENGSKIVFRRCTPKATAGATVDLLLLHDILSKNIDIVKGGLLQTILPTFACRTNSKMIITSSEYSIDEIAKDTCDSSIFKSSSYFTIKHLFYNQLT